MDAHGTRLPVDLQSLYAEWSSQNLPQKGQAYIVMIVVLLSRRDPHPIDKQL